MYNKLGEDARDKCVVLIETITRPKEFGFLCSDNLLDTSELLVAGTQLISDNDPLVKSGPLLWWD